MEVGSEMPRPVESRWRMYCFSSGESGEREGEAWSEEAGDRGGFLMPISRGEMWWPAMWSRSW